jgi:hypothetical protein
MAKKGMVHTDKGSGSLPNRGYVSQQVRKSLIAMPGIQVTSVQFWNGLPIEVRETIADAYGGGDKGRRAVHKCLMNLKQLHGNPRRVGGHGDVNTMWVYTGPKKDQVIFTTETPLAPPKEVMPTKPTLDEADRTFGYADRMLREREEDERRKPESKRFRDYDIPATPIDETFPDPIDRDTGLMEHEPQVGDEQTFVIVGKLSDGSFLWRKEDDGTLGFIEFNPL